MAHDEAIVLVLRSFKMFLESKMWLNLNLWLLGWEGQTNFFFLITSTNGFRVVLSGIRQNEVCSAVEEEICLE